MRPKPSESGFSLVELLVTLVLVLIVTGGLFTAITHAMRASETARAVTSMNANLRTAADLMVRDFIQAGQGVRTVQIPSGAGAMPINRPVPPGEPPMTFDPLATELPAVTPGPDLGPVVNGQRTDTLTTLAADPSFESVGLSALGANSMTVVNTVVIDDGGPDDIRVGDLIMITKGSATTLLFVTRTNGQQVFFETGDPMNLNQFDGTLAMTGTLDWVRQTAPTGATAAQQAAGSVASRIRMITYYLDTLTEPGTPRLVRRIGWGDIVAGVGRGRTAAFGIEELFLRYDLVDGVNNFSDVAMDAADLAGTGTCAPSPCSPNQIRKINLTLRARSRERFVHTQDFFRNSLATQVSLRSLALVDRYQ